MFPKYFLLTPRVIVILILGALPGWTCTSSSLTTEEERQVIDQELRASDDGALIASESDPPDDFYVRDVSAGVYSAQENDNSLNLVAHRQNGILQPCHDGLDAANRFREFIDLDDESAVIGAAEFQVYALPLFLSCQGA